MAVKLTAEQILDIIRENYSETDFAYNDWFETENEEINKIYEEYSTNKNTDYKELTSKVLNYLGLGEVKEVAQYGGEDCGSTWYSVKYFKDHDVYIRIDGHYQSYHGTDFYNGHGYEVRPQEKIITVFE